MSVKASVYKFLLVSFIPLLFFSCNNSTENNPPTVNTNVFPNKVGNEWIYAIHDSLTTSVDTMVVKIVGTTVGNGKEFTIWARRSNLYNDTLYVIVDNNTIYYYTDPYPNAIDQKIEFPLEVGKYWINQDQNFDSSIVKSLGPVTVPAADYPAAYRIERNWGSFNVYGYSVTWFVDNVGIVKMDRRIQGFDRIKESWELLSYTLH